MAKKLSESDIRLIIFNDRFPLGGKLLVPNIHGRFGEMDVLQLSKAGYTTEFEIKTSRADFFADKKKRFKHHEFALSYKKSPSEIPWVKQWMPNYFVYVVPESLKLQSKDVPEYAGLDVITDGGWLKSIKPSVQLHKEKHREFWIEQIAHCLNNKYYYHYLQNRGQAITGVQ